ncbi:hypothetical protein VQ02_33480 [Methylobacterium variabile]|uniref:Uncharacterized protein n=1 Tax=Methylobacterium variabile TaxID=298794 RepID=A0A0J6S148_9HYPH|nr:hypothetical protein [Methylobacterium variabile]KMO27263.1 hypothetical protein VQ02_33480 [Methylobacterium variabile]
MLSSTTPIDAFRASRTKRLTAARATRDAAGPRGPMPDVLVVEVGGYETAREHPATVVVDRERRCLRRNRLRLDMRSEQGFRLCEFLLIHRDQDTVSRAKAIKVARAGRAKASSRHTSHLIRQANRAFRELGLQVESIWGGSLRLIATERSEA